MINYKGYQHIGHSTSQIKLLVSSNVLDDAHRSGAEIINDWTRRYGGIRVWGYKISTTRHSTWIYLQRVLVGLIVDESGSRFVQSLSTDNGIGVKWGKRLVYLVVERNGEHCRKIRSIFLPGRQHQHTETLKMHLWWDCSISLRSAEVCTLMKLCLYSLIRWHDLIISTYFFPTLLICFRLWKMKRNIPALWMY